MGNDEIKEILDKWKCHIGLTKKFTNNDMELLRLEDIEKVINYITTLEHAVKDTKDSLDDMLFELNQENERLKEDLANYVNVVLHDRKVIDQLTNNWNELEEYIGEEWYCFDNESVEFMVARDILDKMKEIKEGKK